MRGLAHDLDADPQRQEIRGCVCERLPHCGETRDPKLHGLTAFPTAQAIRRRPDRGS
jgi:hypothetical protein